MNASFVLVLCVVIFSLLANEKVMSKEIMETKANHYLYKILSLRNWQTTQNRKSVTLSADDDAFIHFSTESQLEKIIEKYWSDAPQLVILKVDSNKLKGRLAYETNPGGTTKYFHLYEGFIPFEAIVEAKIIYRQPTANSTAQQREIVKVGDSVLRTPARELSRDEILSADIQNLIEEMKMTMRAAPGVGLAAPQIGQSIQLAVIEDVNPGRLTPQQLAERNRYHVPFHVIINPRIYVAEDSDWAEFFEGCLSMPSFIAVVPRATSVRVECLNEHAEPIVIHAKGWYARILQHEIDHLNGTLYIDRALLATLMNEETYLKQWKGKTVKEIQEALTCPIHTLPQE